MKSKLLMSLIGLVIAVSYHSLVSITNNISYYWYKCLVCDEDTGVEFFCYFIDDREFESKKITTLLANGESIRVHLQYWLITDLEDNNNNYHVVCMPDESPLVKLQQLKRCEIC